MSTLTSLAASQGTSESATATTLLSAPFQARTWKEVAYALTTLPVAVIGFSAVTVGIATGVGLSVVVIGLPVLAATLALANVGSRFERRRAGWVDPRLRDAQRAPVERAHSMSARAIVHRLRDLAAWRSVLYFVILLPLSVVTFTLTVTVWTFALAALTAPFWNWSVDNGSTRLLGFVAQRPLDYVVVVAVGIVTLIASPWITRAAVRQHLALVALLVR